MTSPEQARPTLLIMSVGGTPEPLVASVLAARPQRMVFVPSPQSRAQVEDVVQRVVAEGLALSPGQWSVTEVADSQDFEACVRVMRRLDREVSQWLDVGPDRRVLVDFTGGTKAMSAALALVARRWRCEFTYVGGTERTKAGVGVVVSGTERIVLRQNPWDALGYQAVEDALLLFDRRNYAGACQTLEGARERAGGATKRTLSTLLMLAQAYDAWDRFQHGRALGHFRDVLVNENDLRVLLGDPAADSLLRQVEDHREWLGRLGRAQGANLETVVDLITNAVRRAEEGRYDDAVARLYRAMEALAQVGLRERHGVESTAAVPVDRLPPSLREAWAGKARNGAVELGLQDAYRLLSALGDEVGSRFAGLGLDGKRSPLTARNQSILAHGFQPVGAAVFEQLRDAALKLAGVEERELPVFPRLRG